MNQINKIFFNPNLWILNNGIIVPKWTIQKKAVSDLDKDVITYSTFAELFPNEVNNNQLIIKEYRRFWLNDILETLAKINYIIFFTQYQKTTKEELAIAINFLPETAVFNFLENKELRKIITRQQILANIRLAFLYSNNKRTKQLILGNEKIFGKLIYRVTDYLENYTKFNDEKNPTKEERTKLYLSLARNLFFNEHSSFVLSLTRYWYLFNKIAYLKRNRPVDIKTLFKQATNVDYNVLLSVGFAIWGFYCDTNKKQRLSKPEEFLFSDLYFKNTKRKIKSTLSSALDIVSGRYSFYENELRTINTNAEHFFLNPFWKKPILKNDRGAYCVLDINFLEERLTEGAYWMIFDHLIKKQVNKSKLSEFGGHWGYIIEDYIINLLESTFPKRPIRVLYENKGDTTGGIDVIIIYPDTLILIEITTKKVPYNHWIDSNYTKIEKSLYRILIKDDNSKGRVVKLYEAIQKFKSGKINLKGFDISNIKNYIPIILFEKAPPMHRRLWHIYNSFIQENGITDRKFLDDLDFWDIEELEMVLADVQKGKSIPEILKEKENAGFFKDSLRNFYIIQRKHFNKHSVTEKAFNEMTKSFTKILFTKAQAKIE